MGFDVIGVGSLVVDIFAESSFFLLATKAGKRLIAFPTEKNITKIRVKPGGSSGNSCCYLAKLGLKVGYFTKLGDDEFAKLLIEDFKRFGVDYSKILLDKNLETGKTVIISYKNRKDVALLVDHGAADFLNNAEVEKNLDYLLATKWLNISSFTSDSSIRAVKFLVSEAAKNGIRIFFAPSKTMIFLYRKKVMEIARVANFVCMNEREALMLTRKRSLDNVLRVLKELGNFCITRGKNGFVCSLDGEGYSVKPRRVNRVINTTGAGDIVAAWILYGLLKKIKPEEFLSCASLAAAIHVQSHTVGARAALTPRTRLIKLTKGFEKSVKRLKF